MVVLYIHVVMNCCLCELNIYLVSYLLALIETSTARVFNIE